MPTREELRRMRKRIVAGADRNPCVSLALTTPPTNAQYTGMPVDLTGLVLTATYLDGTTEVVTSKAICSRAVWGDTATAQKTTFGYREKAVVWTKTPTLSALASIAVDILPTKTAYKFHEQFDFSDMVLTLTYNNGNTRDVTSGWTLSPVKQGNNTSSVTISYTEDEVTKTTTQAVTLVYPASIAIKTPATKLTYADGEELDMAGLEITVTYSDSTTADITTGFSGSPTTIHTGDTAVTVTYAEGNKSATTTYAITVE